MVPWSGRKLAWLVLLAAGCLGCNNEDRGRLERAGRKAGAKAEGLTAGANEKLAGGLQALRSHQDEAALDARVQARLRWDKSLADSAITVQAQEGVIHLHGTIRNAGQRQRAVDLAQATLGVETVMDEMEVREKDMSAAPASP